MHPVGVAADGEVTGPAPLGELDQLVGVHEALAGRVRGRGEEELRRHQRDDERPIVAESPRDLERLV